MKELKSLCNDIYDITSAVAAYIRKETGSLAGTDIRAKGYHDFVSRVDIESEKRLTRDLGRLLPEASFVTEEGTIATGKNRLKWIIDPLDGTTNFLHSLPPYSISIALTEGDKKLTAMVYDITTDEAFWAFNGGGSWCNETAIKVSGATDLTSSLIATGFPYREFGRLPDYLNLLETLMRSTHGVRRMGSAAIDLAYVACGRFDGFFEYNLNPWDVKAGVLLISEAGGKTSGFDGSGDGSSGHEIVASNGIIHEQFREVIYGKMGSKSQRI